MAALIHSMKQRLLDWPRRKVFSKTWEISSVKEHDELIRLLEEGKSREAGSHLRDVHWSYETQEAFIRIYYLTDRPE